jgi:hypothetical protein
MRIKIASILIIAFILPLLAISQQRWYSSFGRPGKWEYINGIEESYDKGYLLYGGYINEVGLLAKDRGIGIIDLRNSTTGTYIVLLKANGKVLQSAKFVKL